MAAKYTTSINILRDSEKSLKYFVTPNAKLIADQLSDDFNRGIHSFTLIGSYGTGKSSFIMAFEEGLRKKGELNVSLSDSFKKISSLKIVGQYQSLVNYFQELYDIKDDFEGNQKIFDALFQASEKCDLLVIYLDEFGKFLEYASKHNPDKELYFIQQLAEFVNDHDRNILLISTLHQNFEAYAAGIAEESQRKEWRKVKGRFKELTFNEPVEQLLFLAAEKLKDSKAKGKEFYALAKSKSILPFSSDAIKDLDSKLAPLDIISAAVLTKALQAYGQNERSLFTFLESDLQNESWASVPVIYDYLLSSFYSYLNSAYNPHYRNWQAIQNSIERAENTDFDKRDLASALVKAIGLLQTFASKSAQVDSAMLEAYFNGEQSKADIIETLDWLEKRSVVRFTRFDNSYKIIEGTDVDFDQVLNAAEESVDRSFDVIPSLEEHFQFPVLQAKEITYTHGTPRLFAFEISNEVLLDLKPENEIDGFVNLIFNDQLNITDIKERTSNQKEAVLYAYFTNSKNIKDRIFEILKTKKVLVDNSEDHVAKQEFEKILHSHERLLSHDVIGALYSDKVRWFFKGEEIKGLTNQRKLNAQLSLICKTVYSSSPIFNNELLNKHKISTSIHTARKNYFKQLSERWNQEDLGFEEGKFPPEKTIYRSLLSANGMHQKIDKTWELTAPSDKNGFDAIWKVCYQFLEDSREEKKSISDLWLTLSQKPYKLKLGLIDFWIPTFLFINRGDFALYEDDRFIPYINESVLYMITRQPEKFQIKAFEISGLRLKVFNKYREFLEQSSQSALNQESFIESVRPFLIFYKDLNEYAKKTSRLSSEALDLRNAITDAKDPEKTFFEAIPSAMKMDLDSIESSEKQLAQFAVKLNEAIQEIKLAYSELLNRFESFISLEIFGKHLEFEDYKSKLAKRYSHIKEHKLLPKQKVFIQRLNSPLNDRDSWLASIAQSVIGKTLDKIDDHEEDVLKDRMQHFIQELDNLLSIQKLKTEEGEQIFKLDITSESGMKSTNVRISKKQAQELEKSSEAIDKLLGKNKKLRLAMLGQLIEKELKE
jgi:hypothetical protein